MHVRVWYIGQVYDVGSGAQAACQKKWFGLEVGFDKTEFMIHVVIFKVRRSISAGGAVLLTGGVAYVVVGVKGAAVRVSWVIRPFLGLRGPDGV